MIVGIGVDIVGIDRFVASLERTPRLREKLFTEVERDLPAESLAARFGAKEALAKALGAPGDLAWHDAWVPRVPGAPPVLEVRGTIADRVAALGIARLHLSLSHDGGMAVAMVVAES